jgi:hypothetical protein
MYSFIQPLGGAREVICIPDSLVTSCWLACIVWEPCLWHIYISEVCTFRHAIMKALDLYFKSHLSYADIRKFFFACFFFFLVPADISSQTSIIRRTDLTDENLTKYVCDEGYTECCITEFDAMRPGRNLSTFRRNVLSESSGLKSKPDYQASKIASQSIKAYS